MTLPLHHCDAVGCRELIDPGRYMCARHWACVSEPTRELLAGAKTQQEEIRAQCAARSEALEAGKAGVA